MGNTAKRFTWIPFYMELADKLLEYRDKRDELVKIVYSLNRKYVNYLHNEQQRDYTDIDPFSIYEIFNRKIKDENRINITKELKARFNLKAEIPQDFWGIPVMMNFTPTFLGKNKITSDIKHLWDLFTSAITGNEDFVTNFNEVIKQAGIQWSITTALYWIRPYQFMTLDLPSQNYFENIGFQIFKLKDLNADNYKKLMEKLKNSNLPKVKNLEFPEISYNAWLEDKQQGRSSKNELQDNLETQLNTFVNLLKLRKNIILQGAPGTGKTYTTAMIALGIIGVDDVDFQDHEQVMKKYEELQKEGRIFFTTFHQSLDYADFVEGVQPIVTEGNGVTYTVKDGIFKKVCSEAVKSSERDICECIDLFLESINGYENRRIIPTISGRSKIYIWWKEGNQTISTKSVCSQPNGQSEKQSKSPLNIESVKLQALGEGEERNWPAYAKAFINAVKKEYHLEDEHSTRPIILIIDEINRGNVSKIFGELITLLEPDKRIGGKHQIQVTLPYSQESFGVPANVYIIGTMNTTDRSTGTLDYALRRRFSFVTLPADEEYITNEKGKELFRNVEKFVDVFQSGELELDDLMVGHSYFMAENNEELKLKMEFEVIPLLKEYVRDGLLTGKKEEMDSYFAAWLRLETYQGETDENENY